MAEPAHDLRALRAPAAFLALLLAATYGYFMPAPAWNETSRFDLVRSLVERRKLDIEPYHFNTGDKAQHAGLHYSDKAPGTALLAAPAYALYYGGLRLAGHELPQALPWGDDDGTRDASDDTGQPRSVINAPFRRGVYVCNLATNVLAGAGLGALFFLVLAAAGVAPRPALCATLTLAVGSHLFPYATMFYGHVLAAAGLFGAFAALGPFFERPGPDAAAGSRLSRRRLLIAGALVGVAVLVELPALLGAAALAAYLLGRAGRGGRLRALALFGAGAAPFAVALVVYQTAAFGSPFVTGYAHVTDPRFAAGMSQGLRGVSLPRPSVLLAMLFGRARGLLYVAPVLALGLAGLVRGLRGPALRREAALAGAMVAAFLLMSAGYYMWWGGSALGPRHVVPALPFLAFGVAWVLPGRRAGWLALLALLGLSAANMLLATAVSPLAPYGPDILFEYVYPHFFRGELAILSGSANVGMVLGLRGPASLAPLVLLWILALRAIVASLPPAPTPVRVEAAGGAG